MAATDIQYGGFDPVIYTPDFSFLKYVLDKKSQQYQQGLKAAAASYNSLKKELTDPSNVERRDKYLKDIEGQLQQIASADFSMQQNVNYANSLFDPVSTDKAILYDQYHTKRIKNEIGRMEAWKNSEDMDVRKQYNAEIQEWVARDLNSLKTGQGNIDNYKVEGRTAAAYVDPQDLLDKAVKEKGFKTKIDNLGQPYIVTVEGGPQFDQNYQTFAENVLASNNVYQRQLQILGQSRQEKVIEKYKADPKWANSSNEDIYKDYARTSFNEHRNTQKQYLDNINKRVFDETGAIDAELKGPNADKYIKGKQDIIAGNSNTQEAQMYIALEQRSRNRNSLDEKAKAVRESYNQTFGSDDGTVQKNMNSYMDNFVKSPQTFFSDLQFKNDVTRFSNIKSASVSRTVKEDRAYVDIMVAKTNAMRAVNDIKDDIHDNAVDDAKLDLKEKELDAKLAMQGKRRVKNADGTYKMNSDGTYATEDGTAGITPIDVSSTVITSTEAITKLKDKVQSANNTALNNMTKTFGALSLLESMGVSDVNVSSIRTAFTKYYNADDKTKVTLTAQETAALRDAYSKMWAFSKNNPTNTFLDQERQNFANTKVDRTLLSRMPDLLERATTGYQARTKNEVEAKRALMDYKNNLQEIEISGKALESGRKYIVDKLGNNPDYAGMFYTKPDGTKDVIDKAYVSKNMMKFKKAINEDISMGFDKRADLTDDDIEDIAEGYVNGAIQFTHHTHNPDVPLSDASKVMFTYKGKEYYIYDQYENGKIITAVPYTSKTFQKYTKEINSQIPIPQFMQGAGIAPGLVQGSPFYEISGENKEKMLHGLSEVTPTNSAIFQYADGTSEATDVPPALQAEIRTALETKDNVTSVKLFTSSPLNGGGQAVKITMKTPSGENPPAWAGKSFYFPISPTIASPSIYHVFSNVNEVGEFATNRKDGTKYHFDAFQAEGVKAEMMPSQAGSNTGYIQLYYKPYTPGVNGQPGSYSTEFVPYGDRMEYDLSKTTFPEIKNNIYETFINPYVLGKIAINNQMKTQAAAAGVPPVTTQSIRNELIKSY
jgi:hypothetical protein